MPSTVGLLPHREIAPEDIPRCQNLDGSTLELMACRAEDEPAAVAVTDGERTAIYVPILSGDLVATGAMDTLRIVPAYTEVGWFTEANVLTLTDGERTAVYVPLRKVDRTE